MADEVRQDEVPKYVTKDEVLEITKDMLLQLDGKIRYSSESSARMTKIFTGISAVCMAAVVFLTFFVPQNTDHPVVPPQPAPVVTPDENNPVVVAKEVTCNVGELTKIQPKFLGKIRWLIPPSVRNKVMIGEEPEYLYVCPKVGSEGTYDVGIVGTYEKDKMVFEYGPMWFVIRSGASPPPDPEPSPKPPVPPVPVPPKPPVPSPSVDTALVTKFKEGIAKDKDVANLAKLAQILQEGSDLLRSDSYPKTMGEFYTTMFNKSVAAKIPRVPALQNVRNTIGTYMGTSDETMGITDSNRLELAAKYAVVSASLKEALK